jgi:hypothetical protein
MEILSNRNRILPHPARVFLPWQGYMTSMLQINVKKGNPYMGLFPFCGNILFELGDVKEIEGCQNRSSI